MVVLGEGGGSHERGAPVASAEDYRVGVPLGARPYHPRLLEGEARVGGARLGAFDF